MKTIPRVLTGIGAGGLIGGGALALMLGGAGNALAAGNPVQGTGSTTATATIANSTTLTDNTPNIATASPATLGANNAFSPAVSLAVSSNDGSGWKTSAILSNSNGVAGNGLYVGTGSVPGDYIDGPNITVQGNGSLVTGVDNGAAVDFAETSGNLITGNGIDSAGGAGNAALSDTWSVNVPASQLPGTYTGSIQYWITPG